MKEQRVGEEGGGGTVRGGGDVLRAHACVIVVVGVGGGGPACVGVHVCERLLNSTAADLCHPDVTLIMYRLVRTTPCRP